MSQNSNTGSNTTPAAPATPAAPLDMSAFSQMLGEAIATGIAKAMPAPARRQMTYGEYTKTRGSYFHPDPAKAVKLTRPSFANGAPYQWENCFDQECALLNRLTRSGRYIDRMVEVSLRDDGGGAQSLHIAYNSKRDGPQGMDVLKSKLFKQPGDVSTLATLLRTLVDAQELENLEEEEELAAKAARRAARR